MKRPTGEAGRRSRSHWNGFVAGASLMVLTMVSVDSLYGSNQPVERVDPTRWEVMGSAFADLWFGALTTIGYDGFGPVPLYAPEYAGAMEAWKTERGLSPTALDRAKNGLRAALVADESFEVLHFVPVYFAGATASEALTSLRALAALPRGNPAGVAPASRFGVAVVASVLTEPAQRAVLADLLEAVEDEWQAMGALPPLAAAPEQIDGVRELWNQGLAPQLADYLNARGLGAGRLVLTPAIGLEGRFFEGDPENPRDNVVVVGLAQDADPATAVAALVRELCYPVVREAFSAAAVRIDDRQQASRLSDRAATRCGAMLLERYAPDALTAYEATFAVGSTETFAGFESLEERLDTLMRSGIQRR